MMDNNLKKIAEEADANQTYWPGEARFKPGIKDKKTTGNITEETRLPEMLNDGKLNNDGANAR